MTEYVPRKGETGTRRWRADFTRPHAPCTRGAAGDLTTVELLLELGADPNAGVHSPLYAVGNECKTKGGADVVKALVKGGADVNARNGVKRCTALHMAARRGNVEVARALIECEAEIGARDSLGDTPLAASGQLQEDRGRGLAASGAPG